MHALHGMATINPPESTSEPTKADVHETARHERSRSHVPEEQIVHGTVPTTADRAFITQPLGWSSILAATVVALGVWLALHLLGIGIGLIGFAPDAGSLRGWGIGVGIWSFIAPIIALFIGGLVAGRMAPTINSLNAAIHGAVVWALTLLLTMLLVVNMLQSVASGVASTGEAVASEAAQRAQQVDAQTMMSPVNEQLQQRGLPPLSQQEMQAVAQDAVTERAQGPLSRQQIVVIVEKRTKLKGPQAQQAAAAIEQQVGDVKQQVGEAGQKVAKGAEKAADVTGTALLAMFALMMLTLGAAIFGSILSVRRERREHVVLPRAHTRVAT